MEPKKNPNLDFSKDRTLLRVLGFAAVLMFCYVMFSFKVFEKKTKKMSLTMMTDDAEMIDNTEQKKAPEPPKPVEIKLVEDTKVVEETIASTELDETEAISEKAEGPKGPAPAEEVVDNTIYENVQNKPSFKGGEDAFSRFSEDNLNYPEAERDFGIEEDIWVYFVIEKDGTLSDINTDGKGNKALQEAAKDFIKKTKGRWTPGSQRGKPVRVKLKLRVSFTLD